MLISNGFYRFLRHFRYLMRTDGTSSFDKLTRLGIVAKCHEPRFLSVGCIERADNAATSATEDTPDLGVDDGSAPAKIIDPRKDRTKQIPLEVSLRYLKSDAFKATYGDNLVWKLYRRNHKGQFPPKKTRPNCVVDGVIDTGNPCPICRDEYLVVDYRNLELLNQFISPYTNEIIDAYYTGVCQFQHLKIRVAVEKARDIGLLTFAVPHRRYDYKQYYPFLKQKELKMKSPAEPDSRDQKANFE